MARTRNRLPGILLAGILFLGACGGQAEPSTGASGADPSMTGTGPITLAQGAPMASTSSSFLRDLIARWNEAHPAEPVTLVPLDENADGQHAQLTENATKGSAAFDVVIIDNEPFHLMSAGEDEGQDGLDEAGGAVWAAADLAEDLPALELRVGPLARAALAGVGGVDLALVAR